MANESHVQVAPDSTGKKIRNIAVTEPSPVDATGAAVADLTRLQQVVTLADERGDTTVATGEVVTELRAIHAALDQLVILLS